MDGPWDETIIPDIDLDDLFDSHHAAQEYASIAIELQKRETEALNLYEPLPFQDKYHKCVAKQCAIIAGNQVGKSLAGFIEDARAVTCQDPYGKYPKTGTLVCVGMDVDHIGLVIYEYLFKPGAFKVIRDQKTGKYRAWKPWLPEDRLRSAETEDAPPLIPTRFVKDIAWKRKKEHICSVAEFTTGWKLLAMGSKGDPKQGFKADLVHIDEDLERPEWFAEAMGRLTMKQGKLRWTALPHVKNDALVNLIERAELDETNYQEAIRRNLPPKLPQTVVFKATVFDNPFQDPETREENIKSWKQEGEDVYRKRALGELTTDSVLMYPTFTKQVHGLRLEREDWETPLPIEAVLAKTGGIPPDDWCRYMIVDPGHQVCAVMFVAVPPPELGEFKVVYDELYIQHCDAHKFGHYVTQTARDQVFQAFLIDAHGGALRDIGSGITPRDQYSQQLKANGIRSEETGFAFIAGSDDVAGRTLRMRDWLYIRPDGTPKMKIYLDKCPNVVREFNRFRKKKSGDMVLDAPDTRSPCHAIQCLEYGAANGLKYVKPRVKRKTLSLVDRVMERQRRSQQKRSAMSAINGGNFINLGPQGS